jgi:hypothetical protein
MNKPVAFLCAGIAGIGLLILGRSTYLTIAYGHGNMEAGNFNRCWYSTTRDSLTGRDLREWDEIGESTEFSLGERFNMWFIGLGLVTLGSVVYVAERATRRPPHEF